MHIYENIEKFIKDFFVSIYKLFNPAINLCCFSANLKLNIEIILYHIFQVLNLPKVLRHTYRIFLIIQFFKMFLFKSSNALGNMQFLTVCFRMINICKLKR